MVCTCNTYVVGWLAYLMCFAECISVRKSLIQGFSEEGGMIDNWEGAGGSPTPPRLYALHII